MNQVQQLGEDAISAISQAEHFAFLDMKDESLAKIYQAEAALKALRYYVFHMKFRSGEVK